jgi:hypothetical protein
MLPNGSQVFFCHVKKNNQTVLWAFITTALFSVVTAMTKLTMTE